MSQRTGASPTDPVSTITPILPQHVTSIPADIRRVEESTRITIPSRRTTAQVPGARPDTSTPIQVASSKSSLPAPNPTSDHDSQQQAPDLPERRHAEVASSARTTHTAKARDDTSSSAAPDQTSPSLPPVSHATPITREEDPVTASTDNGVGNNGHRGHAPQDDIDTPPAKRRKIAGPRHEIQNAESSAPDAAANVPIPTIEDNGTIGEPLINDEAGSTAAQSKTPRKSPQRKGRKKVKDVPTASGARLTQKPPLTARRLKSNAKQKAISENDVDVPEAAAGHAVDGNDNAQPQAALAKPKRTYKKRNTKQSIENTAAQIVEDAVQGSSEDPRKCGRRRRRAETPDGADKVTISPSTITMSELCKDPRTGRKSALERKLAELERKEFIQRKEKQLQEIMGQVEPGAGSESDEPAESRLEHLARLREGEESVAHNVPTTIIVNGQIQIEEESLEVDRHKEAAERRDAEEPETIEESDLTRKVNSGSYLKRDLGGGWNELLTDRFYQGLRMFGTDFGMISKMFPGRTRHKIKLKFVKEEKSNYDKIRATLLGDQVPVDLPELERIYGTEFDDPEELEKDLREDRKRLEEETLAEKEAMEDARKEREEQIRAEREAAGDESSAKENRRRQKKKKGETSGEKDGTARRKEKRVCRMGSTDQPAVLNDIGAAA